MHTMISFLSDNHAEEFLGDLRDFAPKDKEKDLLILLGDTCLKLAETPRYQQFSQWLLSRDYSIAIVDGNHENYTYLNQAPEEEWMGGIVNRLTENIVRLKRGELYRIQGSSFFVFGGCGSSAAWRAKGLWQEGELPSAQELAKAYETLKRADYRVDYILMQKYFCNQCHVWEGEPEYELFKLNRFIDANVQFKRWFSGHRHEDREIDDKHRVVFQKTVALY